MMKQKRWNMQRGNKLLVNSLVMLAAGILSVVAAGANRYVAGSLPERTQHPWDSVRIPPVAHDMLRPGADTLTLPLDSIGRREALRAFYEALDSLRAGKDTVIQVVHLGDSHIQAGHYSGRVMRLLQQQFGNAGRGWISPLKLSRTNEPSDYFITSVVRSWTAGRAIQRTRKTPLGPGGIGIRSVSPSINLDVMIAPNNGAGFSFNRAVLFRGERSMPMLPAGKRKEDVTLLRADSACVPGILADTFRIAGLADTLQLQSSRRNPGTDRLLPASAFRNDYFGFVLTNGLPGILYHSIGVNGAMFVNYAEDSYVKQLALLRPTLLILSLGTNETFGRRFNEAEFSRQVEDFLRLVRRYMPHTSILLTTPPECYRRVYVKKRRTYQRNANTEKAARTLVAIARREGIACWDLFTATGGRNSSRKWLNQRLLGRDRIHFTQEGYREQGTLLYRALMNDYQQKH